MGSLTTILGNTLTLILGPLMFGDGSFALATSSLAGVVGDVAGDGVIPAP
ncbi:hypothetical protein [Tomitella gaofuii]|nr:hypothetical protein [Tomitella gaofuii]